MPKNTVTITYTGKKKRPKNKSGKAPLKSGPCCFCLSYKDKEEDYGKLIKKNGFVVHYFCLLFSSALCQRGRTDKEGIYGFLSKDIDKELARGSRLKCDYCKNPGATIGCVVTSCRRKFHFVCGKENGSLHQFYDTFRSFCPDHRPEQSYIYDNKSKKTATCPICMSTVPASCSVDTLKSNCCKNSWFHRSCIQRYGLSAGLHFFKCPMCNDVDKFQKEMLEFGIYIPDQDASWEKEPNAFTELLERHNACDAEHCKCPYGRNDSPGGKWEILLCSSCGSVGSHVGCNGLIFIKRTDEQLCIDCWDIHQRVESKKKTGKQKATSKSPKIIKTVSLTEAQRERQLKEWKARKGGADTLVNIKNCDTDADIDVVSQEDCGTQIIRKSVLEQNPMSKRQKLSLDGSRRSTGNTSDSLSANITLTDDSRGHKVTATISRSSSRSSSNSSVSVASSHVSNSGLPDLSQRFQDSDSDSETESCDSSSFSINTVTDLPQRKALTISWRGRKVQITNPSTPEKHNWSLQLQMGNNTSQTPSSSRRSSTSSSSYTRSGQTFTRSSSSDDDCNEAYRESPPLLVPVDDEISVRVPTKSLSEKFSWEDDTMSAPTRYGPFNKYTSARNSSFPEDIPSSKPNPRPVSSSESIISISSSDSDNGDQLNPRKKRNRNFKKPAVANTEIPSNVVDLTEHDMPSTIRLIPRYLVRPPIRLPVMEPEVVILD